MKYIGGFFARLIANVGEWSDGRYARRNFSKVLKGQGSWAKFGPQPNGFWRAYPWTTLGQDRQLQLLWQQTQKV